MEEHHLKVARTARYYSLGKITESTTHLWIVCHGYGQLASRVIQKFNHIDLTKNFVIAPEGLSRFYWQGVTGVVAASWMTKADRLHEIEDYSNYLQELLEIYQTKHPHLKVVFFGFSQGCATIIRWMMAKFPKLDQAILWAGFFPEDLNYLPHQGYLKDINFQFIYGDKDEYLTPGRISMHEQLIVDQKLVVKSQAFSGKHVIDRKILTKVVEKINASDHRATQDPS